jgi:glycosyltransferase involved in cell wall biosynthesis
MNNPIEITVAVVPREKFSLCQTSLASLLENTTIPFKLLFIDGNFPVELMRWVEQRLANRPNTEILHYDYYLGPVQAYNIAVEKADTKYIVFMDNDMYVRPGCIEALYGCAEETQADVVSPIILEGGPATDIVHAYGGEVNFVIEGDKCEFFRVQRYADEYLSQTKSSMVREQSHLVENHMSLARTSSVKLHGHWDEWMGNHINAQEYSLIFDLHEQTLMLEPRAEAVYMFSSEIRPSWKEFTYWNVMWSENWRAKQYNLFSQKYGLNPNLNKNRPYVWWLGHQRRMIYYPIFEANRRFWAKLHMQKFGYLVQKVLEYVEVGFNYFYVEANIRRKAYRKTGVPSIFGSKSDKVTPANMSLAKLMKLRTRDKVSTN